MIYLERFVFVENATGLTTPPGSLEDLVDKTAGDRPVGSPTVGVWINVSICSFLLDAFRTSFMDLTPLVLRQYLELRR
jgi:hypothetical protein